MWPLHRPIVQIAIRFEYLALDEVWRTHRGAMILTRISGSNTKRRLKRRTVLCNGIQFQSLETCSRGYCTLNTVFHIIRFVNHSCTALGAVVHVRIDSLGVSAIG